MFSDLSQREGIKLSVGILPQQCWANTLPLRDIHLSGHNDNNNRRLSYLQNNAYGPQLNANLPRRRNATQKKAFSAPKRQILISEIFARIPNKKFTHDGNLELVNSATGYT